MPCHESSLIIDSTACDCSRVLPTPIEKYRQRYHRHLEPLPERVLFRLLSPFSSALFQAITPRWKASNLRSVSVHARQCAFRLSDTSLRRPSHRALAIRIRIDVTCAHVTRTVAFFSRVVKGQGPGQLLCFNSLVQKGGESRPRIRYMQ